MKVQFLVAGNVIRSHQKYFISSIPFIGSQSESKDERQRARGGILKVDQKKV
jgi:hypothetical protein